MVQNGNLLHILKSDLESSTEQIFLPLFIDKMTGGEAWNIFQPCLESDKGSTIGVGVVEGGLTLGSILPSIGDLLISKVLLHKDLSSEEKVNLLQILKNHGVKIPTDVFVNEWSMVLYHILVHVVSDSPSQIQRLLDEELYRIFCDIFAVLYNVASAAMNYSSDQIPLSERIENKNLNKIVFSQVAFHNVQLQLVWDLGSADESVQMKANRALQVLCVIGTEKSLQRKITEVSTVDTVLQNYVAENLPGHFLFIMKNLIQKSNWALESSYYKENSIRSLRHIVSYLREANWSQFLPKVIIL